MSGRERNEQRRGNITERQRRILRDPMQGITKSAIRRLARRAGIRRISGDVYNETRRIMLAFIENALKEAIKYTEHAQRRTITELDIIYAFKRLGVRVYGFDP